MFGRTTCGCAITDCSSATANVPGGCPSCSASLSDMFSPFCTLNELLSVCTNFIFFDHDVLSKIHPASDTMSTLPLCHFGQSSDLNENFSGGVT